ncbi:MAG: rhodanese-like domain-containing protein, partial [Nevskiales bacterium]|nr:rhodanese-like domain-containing protein [Nevskiales bacterium]
MELVSSFVGHHPILFSGLGVVVILLILNEMSGALTGEKRLTPLEAVRLINDRGALILDVRSSADY